MITNSRLLKRGFHFGWIKFKKKKKKIGFWWNLVCDRLCCSFVLKLFFSLYYSYLNERIREADLLEFEWNDVIKIQFIETPNVQFVFMSGICGQVLNVSKDS